MIDRHRLEGLGRQLPLPLKASLKRAAGPIDAGYRWAWRRRTGDPRPVPPVRLRSRVGSGVSLPVFVGTGQGSVRALEQALRDNGATMQGAGRILDFGCGCGRIVAGLLFGQLVDEHATEIHGCDVDAEAVAWCERHLRPARFAVNGFAPPLPYEDAHFDVLYSSSIFTHLPEAQGDAWLREIERVLAPGGHALVTVAGEAMFDAARSGDTPSNSRDFSQRLGAMPDVRTEGIVFEPYVRSRWNEGDFPGIDDTYGVTYHSREYVREHWGEVLEVLDHRPKAMNYLQDLVVLRKPAA